MKKINLDTTIEIEVGRLNPEDLRKLSEILVDNFKFFKHDISSELKAIYWRILEIEQ